MFLSPASSFRISVLLGIFPLPKSRYGPTLYASVARSNYPNFIIIPIKEAYVL